MVGYGRWVGGWGRALDELHLKQCTVDIIIYRSCPYTQFLVPCLAIQRLNTIVEHIALWQV